MNQTYQVLCLSEAVSPITHAMGTAGNESLIMREPVVTNRGIAHVPCLSGNALRHRAVREPGVRWLVEQYGLGGKLSLEQLNFLFHGGSLTEGGGRENTRLIADMQRLLPIVKLCGGSLPSQILAGALQVWRGTLVCEENRSTLAAMVPWEFPRGTLRNADEFVSGWQYTRGDAAKDTVDLMPAVQVEADSNLMIFGGQSVVRGACFVHGFTVPHVSRRELGALLLSLSLWQAAGGTIGGQAARGHGRLETSIAVFVGGEEVADWPDSVAEYSGYAMEVAEDATAWLNEAFARSPAEKKNGRAKKAAGSLLA